MIAWQVRVEKYHEKQDALGQKDNYSLVTSSSAAVFLIFSSGKFSGGELTDWLRFHTSSREFMKMRALMMETSSSTLSRATTPKSGARGYS
ncbi:hypothetical protein TNCV_649811 [Trichonephila clavipes]|nr:hypothetical protein TNCV_649811 [Trichonephila clavipes]